MLKRVFYTKHSSLIEQNSKLTNADFSITNYNLLYILMITNEKRCVDSYGQRLYRHYRERSFCCQ
jgi:hypothetical protein